MYVCRKSIYAKRLNDYFWILSLWLILSSYI